MDEDRARDFWERALGEIEDGGFFAPVQTAAPPEAKPAVASAPRAHRRHPTNVELVAFVVFISLLLVLAVVSWLAPALF
jgi:hypothetical protein